jgi:hypothetical protein
MALSLQQIREENPRYAKLDDNQLANYLHKRYYSDMPFKDYATAIGYEDPNADGDMARGFKNTFRQLPELGYGLLAAGGATAEHAFGEGGIATGIKQAGVRGYQEAAANLQENSKESDSLTYSWDKAKQGDFNALADWLQYGLGYAGGQGLQMLATGLLGGAAAKMAAPQLAQALTEKMVETEAAKIAATEGAKTLTADAIRNQAVKMVAGKIGNIGAATATGAAAFGMEGGEIGGDMVAKAEQEGRKLTGDELAKGFGATLASGSLEFVGDMLGLGALTGKIKIPGVGGMLATGAATAAPLAAAEGATEYGQTLLEEWGKGNDPFSDESRKQAIDAAGLGAVGGGAMGFAGGAVSGSQKPKTELGPIPAPTTSAGITANVQGIANASSVDEAIGAADAALNAKPDAEAIVKSQTIPGQKLQETIDLQYQDGGYNPLAGAWEQPTAKPLPRSEYDGTFQAAAEQNGVPYEVLKALATQESGIRQFDKNGKVIQPSTSNALGIMQIIPKWHPEFDPERLANDPDYNIHAGAQFLGELIRRNNGDVHKALQGYYGSKDPAENQHYADAVLARINQNKAAGTDEQQGNIDQLDSGTQAHGRGLPSSSIARGSNGVMAEGGPEITPDNSQLTTASNGTLIDETNQQAAQPATSTGEAGVFQAPENLADNLEYLSNNKVQTDTVINETQRNKLQNGSVLHKPVPILSDRGEGQRTIQNEGIDEKTQVDTPNQSDLQTKESESKSQLRKKLERKYHSRYSTDIEYANKIINSKLQGNKHLDDYDNYVESTRGKKISYINDDKETGTVLTRNNNGDTLVKWNDEYSANKNNADPIYSQNGKKIIGYQSWLFNQENNQYVVHEPSKNNTSTTKTQPAPQDADSSASGIIASGAEEKAGAVGAAVKEVAAPLTPKNKGPHYAAGFQSAQEGGERTLPSGFKPNTKKSNDWFKGFDAAVAQAKTQPTGIQPNDQSQNPAAKATEAEEAVTQENAQSLAGEKINKSWVKFSYDSKSLNIPRAEMPQVKAEHRGALVNFLNAKGISHEKETVPANELKPTQAEFSPEKVKKAQNYEGGDRSILISSDNHVVDGHHQWLAKLDNNEDVNVIRLNAPIKTLLNDVNEFPSAEQRAGAKSSQPIAQTPEKTPETKPNQADNFAKTATKPAKPKTAIVSDKDDLLAAIAKLGGLNRDEAKAQGIDPKEFNTRGSGIKRVFTKAGKSYDEMAELLRDYHFDMPMANDLVGKVSRAINQGEKFYNPTGYEQIMALKAQERYDDDQAQVHMHLEDAIEAGDIAVEDLEEALDNLDDLGIKSTFTGQEAIKALNDFFGIDDNEQSEIEASAGKSDTEALKSYTEQELADRERAAKQRLKQEQDAEVKAQQKEQADKERDSLVDDFMGTRPKTNDVFGMTDPLEDINKKSAKPVAENESKFSKSEDTRFVKQALDALAKYDEFFRFPISQKNTIEGVMADVFPSARYRGFDEVKSRHLFAIKDGHFFVYDGDFVTDPKVLEKLPEPKGKIWIDVSPIKTGSGGSAIYFALGNYANNSDKVFIGDPDGLSQDAVIRRTANMLSMALRFGTTKFMEPSIEQIEGNPKAGIEPLEWEGSDQDKTESLIHTFITTLHNQFPEIKNARYDFERRVFLDIHNRPVHGEYFDRIREGAHVEGATKARVGPTTARQGILIQSLISSESGKRPGLLEKLLRWNSSVIQKGGLGKIFSKTEPKKSGYTVEEIKALLPNRVKALVKSGKLKVVQSVDDLPAYLQERGTALYHAAFHGSPHAFDRFSLEHIGTGEGAQAFGFGLYFTDKKEIAEYYKDTLGKYQWKNEEVAKKYEDGVDKALLRQLETKMPNEILAMNKQYADLANGEGKPNFMGDMYNALKSGDFSAQGKLYQVELAPAEDEYLDWNKPLSEQSDKVKAALKDSGLLDYTLPFSKRDQGNEPNLSLTGGEFYKAMSDGYDEDASNTLHKAGVRGIRYAAEQGKSDASNYVIFSDDDITITAKYSQNLAGVEALYDGKNDQMYLVADMLNQKNLKSILAHELMHRALAIDPKVRDAVSRFDSDLKARFERAAQGKGSAIERAAYDRVIKAKTPPKDQQEEFVAYLISAYNKNPDSFTGRLKKVIQDFIAAIRAALLRAGIPLNSLTPADLNALAMYGARVQSNAFASGNGRSLRSFAGGFAQTADLRSLALAKQRLENGEDAETVRQQTGWHRAADGKWKFEIDDSDARMKGEGTFEDIVYRQIEAQDKGVSEITLGNVLDHPALFAAYPALKDMKVRFTPSTTNAKGQFVNDGKTQQIDVRDSLSAEDALSTIMHEVQHGIQHIEGFATGGNAETLKNQYDKSRARLNFLEKEPEYQSAIDEEDAISEKLMDGEISQKEADQQYRDLADKYPAYAEVQKVISELRTSSSDGLSAYKRLAGEVEARNTQARLKMNAEYRKNFAPDLTQDIGNDEVIVVFNGKEMANLPLPDNARESLPEKITIDGEERWTINSNGQPIAQDEEGIRNFWKWFGESGTVNDDGQPIVFYHGTGSDFSSFNTFSSWFSESRGFANEYAGLREHQKPGSSSVMPAYIISRNAFNGDALPKTVTANQFFTELLKQSGINDNATKAELKSFLDEVRAGAIEEESGPHYSNWDFWHRPREFFGGKGEEAMSKAFRLAGFDSINFTEDGEKTLGVLSPRQIKSAIGNNGSFSPNTDNIKFSRNASNSNDDAITQEFKRRAGLGPKKTLTETIEDILSQGIDANWQLVKDKWTELKPQIEQGIFDKFLGIKLAEQEILGEVSHSLSGYIGARFSTGSSSTMSAVLQYGAPEWRDGIIQRKDYSKGFAEILQPVKDDLENFTAWMVARRADRLFQEGKENNFTREMIDAGLALKQSGYQDVADDIAKLNASILDLAEDSGLIDPQSRALWESADYIPFYRLIEGKKPSGPRGKKGLSHQSSGIKMLKGGENPMSDPLGNMMQNWAHLIDAAMKNSALDKTLTNLEGSRFVTPVPRVEFEQATIPKEQIKKLMLESGLPREVVDAMPVNLTEGIAKLWAMKSPTSPDVVRVMRNGKTEYYRVNDGMLLTSLVAVNQSPLPGIFKPMRYMKSLLTSAVTADPTFMARNFIRDSLHSWTIADQEGFRIGLDSIQGAIKSFHEEGGYIDMMFAGASFQGGYGNYNNPDAARTSMDAALRKHGIHDVRGFADSILDTPKKYWEAYRSIGDAIENANREAILENSKKAGSEKAQYLFESKDIMDFSMQGSFTLIRAMSDMLPFFNARLIGLYRLMKAGNTEEARRIILMKGTSIALFSLALLAINSDNDDYKALEDFDLDGYWHFFFGDQHYRIPKPFELGLIFGTIPERSARLLLGEDTLKEFAQRMGHGASDTLAFNPIPQMFRPFLELYANKDMFTGRPIENMSDEGKLPSARYNAYTSETMRTLSRVLPEALGASPKRLEHLVQGYTGAMGMYILGASDSLVRVASGMPDSPSMRLDRVPVLKAFYQEAPAMHTAYGTQFYDMLKETEQVQRTINAYVKEGEFEKADALRSENADKLKFRKQLNKTNKTLGELRHQVDAIYRSDLSSSEKRKRIDQLMEKANKLQRTVVQKTHPFFR